MVIGVWCESFNRTLLPGAEHRALILSKPAPALVEGPHTYFKTLLLYMRWKKGFRDPGGIHPQIPSLH